MINLSLLLLIISLILLTIGFVKQKADQCDPNKIDIRIYPRHIYDELILDVNKV